MRTNDRKYDKIVSATPDTPYFEKLKAAMLLQYATKINEINYKVVDMAHVKGQLAKQFFLKKVW